MHRPGLMMAAFAAWLAVFAGGTPAQTEDVVRGGPPKGAFGHRRPTLARDVSRYLERLAGVGYAGCVGITIDGKEVLVAGFGAADAEAGRAMTPNAVFTVGSITKQFTAAAIMALEADGKLKVEDPITRFFDDVPKDKAEITVHQLLTHSAGIVGFLGGDFDTEATRDFVVKGALAAPLRFAPGRGYAYSNTGYSLLAAIVEKASGKGYETYLRERLLVPAGVGGIGYLAPKYPTEQLAVGYRNGERWGTVLGHPMLEDGPCWNLRGNGGIHAAARDMLRWVAALEGNEILPAAQREKLVHPWVDEGGGRSHYGYGWVVSTSPRGRKRVEHNGGNGVFSADLVRYVDDGVVLFVASSVSEIKAFQISRKLGPVIFGGPVSFPPNVVAMKNDELDALAGTYRLPSGGSLTVTRVGGRLSIVGEGADAWALLSGGSGKADEAAEAYTKRSVEILTASLAGDVKPLRAALGTPMEEAALLRRERRWQQGAAQRRGELGGVRPYGAAPTEEGVRVTVEVEGARGPTYVFHQWREGKIVRMGIGAAPPPVPEAFHPVGGGAFRSFSLADDARLVVSFLTTDGARALRIGSVSARAKE